MLESDNRYNLQTLEVPLWVLLTFGLFQHFPKTAKLNCMAAKAIKAKNLTKYVAETQKNVPWTSVATACMHADNFGWQQCLWKNERKQWIWKYAVEQCWCKTEVFIQSIGQKMSWLGVSKKRRCLSYLHTYSKYTQNFECIIVYASNRLAVCTFINSIKVCQWWSPLQYMISQYQEVHTRGSHSKASFSLRPH